MPINKRNWRKQEEHLRFARGVREVKGKRGEAVAGDGRPSAQNRVAEWRQKHPKGRKADYHRDTGLDQKTIRKWWDCPSKAACDFSLLDGEQSINGHTLRNEN